MSATTPDFSLTSPKARRAYGALTALNILLTCLVFADPIYSRLFLDGWRRGDYPYVNTLSLDIHAVVGVTFILLVSGQFMLGYVAERSAWTAIHRRVGRPLLYVLIPLFIGSALWATVDRAWSIPPEDSVIFRDNVWMLVVYLVTLLGFAGVFLARSARAIRAGDVQQHMDSMVAGITMFAGIVWIRFLYVLYWKLIGPTPYTIMGMTQITAVLMVGLLCAAFAVAGRLRQNRRELIALGVWIFVFSVVLSPFYDFFDS